MKTLILLLLLTCHALATTPKVTIVSGDPYRAVIKWDPNPPEQNVYGYFLYLVRMDQPGQVNRRLFISDTSVELTDFEPGVEYSVSVSAVNIDQIEGQACSPVRFFPSPKTLAESVLWKAERVGEGVLQISRDLRTWQAVASPYYFNRRTVPQVFIRVEY